MNDKEHHLQRTVSQDMTHGTFSKQTIFDITDFMEELHRSEDCFTLFPKYAEDIETFIAYMKDYKKKIPLSEHVEDCIQGTLFIYSIMKNVKIQKLAKKHVLLKSNEKSKRMRRHIEDDEEEKEEEEEEL